MFKTAVHAAFYTLMNVRYAALVIPTAAVAVALHLTGLDTGVRAAAVALGLLALAMLAELGLSLYNGVTAANQIKARDDYMAGYLADIEKYANDWTRRGSEDSAEAGSQGRQAGPEGEAPDEGEAGGQAPVPAR
jgi:hypothetical protein